MQVSAESGAVQEAGAYALMKLMCAKGEAVLDTLRDIDGAGVLMAALRGHA
eukprot:COSAG01_NODE_53946_length_335_cov_1.618644_1_plen_50_part_01